MKSVLPDGGVSSCSATAGEELKRSGMRDTPFHKVLMVAFHFHPDLEVGAVRSVKFAKYLPEFGWQVHVVSVASAYYGRTDSAPLPFECAVHRAGMWPTLLTAASWLKNKRARWSHRIRQSAADANPANPQVTAPLKARRGSFWQRLVVKLGTTPDAFIGWLMPATSLAVRVARREHIDVIYSSGPPHTGHIVGFLASCLTGRPLVTDFRDPWTTRPAPAALLDRVFFRIGRMLESLIVRRSRLVLGSTQAICQRLRLAHQPRLATKCVALLNGYDAEDFPVRTDPPERTVGHVLSFVYAGTLYAGRNPVAFLRALGEMIKEGRVSRDAIVVEFYGSVEIEAAPLQAVIDEFSLRDIVAFRASVGRQEYLRLLRDADVLVLIQGDETPWAIPAKAFEYLATGNEILLLAGSHEVAELLEDYDNVHRSDLEDSETIRACITAIISRIASGTAGRERNRRPLSHLHKRQLTKEFARLLDTVVSKE